MAKQRVIEEITEMMTKYSDTEVRKKLSKSEVHQVEITTQETVAGLLNSTPAALEMYFWERLFLLQRILTRKH